MQIPMWQLCSPGGQRWQHHVLFALPLLEVEQRGICGSMGLNLLIGNLGLVGTSMNHVTLLRWRRGWFIKVWQLIQKISEVPYKECGNGERWGGWKWTIVPWRNLRTLPRGVIPKHLEHSDGCAPLETRKSGAHRSALGRRTSESWSRDRGLAKFKNRQPKIAADPSGLGEGCWPSKPPQPTSTHGTVAMAGGGWVGGYGSGRAGGSAEEFFRMVELEIRPADSCSISTWYVRWECVCLLSAIDDTAFPHFSAENRGFCFWLVFDVPGGK